METMEQSDPLIAPQEDKDPKIEIRNVVVLGVSFLGVLAAFQTNSFFVASVLKDQGHGNLGFVSLGILYFCFCLTNFFAPFIISKVGLRGSMLIGGSMYILMLVATIYVIPGVFMVASGLNGVGAACLWTAQGSAITVVSQKKNRGRNAGIFFTICQMSLIIGSLTSMIVVSPGETSISVSTARTLYSALAVMCACGVLCLLFLSGLAPVKDPPRSLLVSLKDTFSLLKDYRMVLVCILIFYSGLELSFWQGQYPTLVGGKENDISLPSDFRPRAIAYLLIVFGVSEILGSYLSGKISDIIGRGYVVMFGMGCHITTYYLIYLNLINQNFRPTLPLAFVYAFFLGIGDSIYNTQAFSILGALYPDNSATAFALNFFAKSLASAIAFYYSGYLALQYQLLLLALVLLVGTLGYMIVERNITPDMGGGGFVH